MSYEPCNISAEQNLLGSIMNNVDTIGDVTSIVSVDNFFSSEHRDIYSTIKDMHENDKEIDCFTIAERAKELGFDFEFDYIGRIQVDTPKSSHFSSYAKSVIEKSKEREMISALEESVRKIKSGEGSTSERLHHSIANVNAIDPDSMNNETYSVKMKDVALTWLDDYEDKIENPDRQGITTGISGVDEIIGDRGIQPGDVVVIAARPKMMKTATMTKIANHIGLTLKKTVQTFSMEMRNNLMFERTLTQETGVTNDNFYKVMSNDNYERVNTAITNLIPSEMYIDDRSNLTLNEVRREVRAQSKKMGGYGSLGAIMLDYFTLMDLDGDSSNPSFGYAKLSKGIVSLAKEVGCPIFLLAQLNRDCEKRPDKRPMPFDLGDTGQLERDASLILMLYKDDVYYEDSVQKGLLELIVRVNRNGGTGTAFQTTTGGRLGDITDAEIGKMQAEAEYQSRMQQD